MAKQAVIRSSTPGSVGPLPGISQPLLAGNHAATADHHSGTWYCRASLVRCGLQTSSLRRPGLARAHVQPSVPAAVPPAPAPGQPCADRHVQQQLTVATPHRAPRQQARSSAVLASPCGGASRAFGTVPMPDTGKPVQSFQAISRGSKCYSAACLSTLTMPPVVVANWTSTCTRTNKLQLQYALAECCVLPLQRRQRSACVSQLRVRSLQVGWQRSSFLQCSTQRQLLSVSHSRQQGHVGVLHIFGTCRMAGS